jgi:adenylate cyclase
MGIEIEKKFLLTGTEWKQLATGTAYRQGYLNSAKERTVRVRTINDQGFLTIKGVSVGATRLEYEYEIPLEDANALLDELCEKPLIEKNRYKVNFSGFTWEIDEFFGENDGLIVAEIELESEDQTFDKPDWVGEEVTGDSRYFNSNLINNPYSKWE